MKRARAISLLTKKRAEHFLHSSLNHGESLTCSLYALLLHLYNAIWKAMEKPKLFLPEYLQKNTEGIPTLPMKLLLVSSLALILAVSGSVEAWRRPRTLTQSKTQQWCVASEDATDAALQEALDWACSSQGGADCTLIQSEGACFLPNTLKDHASFAFNDYWQKFKGHGGTCDFKGSALLVDADPSHNHCSFPLLP